MRRELAALARRPGGRGWAAQNALDFAVDVQDAKCMLCADHAMQVLHNTFGSGLSSSRNYRIESLLANMSAFLEHCDRQVTTEEVTHYLEKDHPSHEAAVARHAAD